MAAAPLKVCIVGSGNWGSAVAKIIGDNVKKLQKFASTVKMWVFEETVNGRKLTDIINNDHENVKYLPGHKLPENVVAVANLSEAVQDADLLVFVIPHQFIHRICEEITGRVPKDALGITLIKGIDEGPEGLKLISDIIREKMGIDISVLMGANIANEVAAGKFCETTIGSKVIENGLLFKELLQTPNFRITVVDDADTVELCGALKNIVAVGAGFCDGLRCGDNTKAAVIRLGLMEMIAFARIFCKGQVSTATFLESCGVADLITTCYGGRNRRVAEAFARTGKTIEELEKEMLNGQKLQGPQTSAEVYRILKQKGLLNKLRTHRPSGHGSRAQPLRGMRDPPGPGHEPVSPVPAGRLPTTAPPGKPRESQFLKVSVVHCGVPDLLRRQARSRDVVLSPEPSRAYIK
ncbi:glycerol-3-phosphate dehydrogenase 1-like protein isoform X1 [Phocoena sinus]|uniref:Glycerol-3-phosphate dehydrogenase [NAD(+)] n=1 Tax=Phocoena sinus TaxID=42100 RepID=A0A8C9BQK1_PHOSS|nr:glycerol-3-phosphate dehydrogenase 1-like protein isoform X1 [Phocoena sinus]